MVARLNKNMFTQVFDYYLLAQKNIGTLEYALDYYSKINGTYKATKHLIYKISYLK